MSSVGDVDPGVTAATEDELNQRATAAARAFAALNLDEDGEPTPSEAAPAEHVTDPEPGSGPLRPDAVFHGFVRGGDAPGAGAPTAVPGDEPPGWDGPDGRRGSTAGAWPGGVRGPGPQPTRPDTGPDGGPHAAASPHGGAGTAEPGTSATGDQRAGGPASATTVHRAAATSTATATATSGQRRGASAADDAGATGSVGGTAATTPGPGFDPPARRVDRHLLDLWAAAAASIAFVSPATWLAVVAAVAATAAVVRSMADHGPGPAGVVRRALHRARRSVRPRTLAAVVVIVVHGALTAVLVPAALAMAWWGVCHGSVGVLAAGRTGVLAQAPRAAVALACYALIAGLGPVRERRIAHVRRLTGQVSGSTVAAMAVGSVLFAVGVTTVVPRADAGPLAGDDGLGWAPPSVRGRLDLLRDVVVEAELHAAAGCLNGPHGVRWDASYTRRNPLGDEDVARLTFGAGLPAAGDLTTAAAALHNQLAPWVETIELAAPSRPLVVVDRTGLPSSSPLTDPAALAEAATKGRALVEDGMDDFDRSRALDCSVSPVL
jgi:hypothetical protein